jgi:O-succinylbenzoate synthase
MILAGFEVFRYNLPITVPLQLKNRVITRREGLILKLWDENGNMGYGEIIHLPGFHQQPLQDFESELDEAIKNLQENNVPQKICQLDGQFRSWLESYCLSSSVQTGVEMAILNLLASSRNLRLVELFDKPFLPEIKLNGLILYGREDLFHQTKILTDSGYEIVKLKVGQGDIDSDVERVKKVRKAAGPQVKLRLDANQSWDLEEAILFSRSVGSEQIEYIEEPLKDPTQLSHFYGETGLPVALDESLLNLKTTLAGWPEGVNALVLKPALLGGIEKIVQIIRMARKAGIYSVLSSLFESGIGLSVLAQLAAVYCSPDISMGLDTWRWMEEDLLQKPFRPHGGKIIINELPAQDGNINMQKLVKISGS